MTKLAPGFTVKRDEEHREIHYSVHGLWSRETIGEWQKGLLETSMPFILDNKPFRVLGDMTNFPVQPKAITGELRAMQEESRRVGVERMALICTSILMKQQAHRVSDALEHAIFDNRTEALAWLRADR